MEIPIGKNILDANQAVADENARLLAKHNILALNLMSSPGAGKTTLLEATILAIGNELKPAVVEGDLATSLDQERIRRHGVPAVQINTTSGCHLTAAQVRDALAGLPLQTLDILFIENVGNLVCPAAYDLGERLKVVLFSLPEGEEKPLKYPVMFRAAQALVLNKLDLQEPLGFDLDLAISNARTINPQMKIFPLSCRTGHGLAAWLDWLREMRRREGMDRDLV